MGEEGRGAVSTATRHAPGSPTNSAPGPERSQQPGQRIAAGLGVVGGGREFGGFDPPTGWVLPLFVYATK